MILDYVNSILNLPLGNRIYHLHLQEIRKLGIRI